MENDDLKLWQPQVFDRRFYEYLRTCKTQIEAYEKTEADHKRVFGTTHYSGWDSYAHARNRRKKSNNVHG